MKRSMTKPESHSKQAFEPTRNISSAVLFILKGAQKRRELATKRALLLQQNMGLVPRLALIKQ